MLRMNDLAKSIRLADVEAERLNPFERSIMSRQIHEEYGKITKQFLESSDPEERRQGQLVEEAYRQGRAIYECHLPSNRVYYNDAAIELLGVDPNEDHTAYSWVEKAVKDDVPRVMEAIGELYKDPTQPLVVKFRLKATNGRPERWISSTSIAVIRNESIVSINGEMCEPGKIIKSAITSAIHPRGREFERKAHFCPFSVVHTKINGRLIWANTKFCDMCGYKLCELANEIPGHLLQGLLTTEESKEAMRKAMRDRSKFHGPVNNYTKEGKMYTVELIFIPIHSSINGSVLSFLAVCAEVDSSAPYGTHTTALEAELSALAACLSN
jgi:PAS domain S-box-containing protein